MRDLERGENFACEDCKRRKIVYGHRYSFIMEDYEPYPVHVCKKFWKIKWTQFRIVYAYCN